MSRIGRAPIEIPSNVTVEINGRDVVAKGPKGELKQTVLDGMTVKQEENQILVTRADDSKEQRSLHGLTRTLINNMIVGVSEGFTRILELHGVGYRVNVAGNVLKLGVGYSHDVDFEIPEGIQISVDGNEITVTGIDKQLVGQTAALIRKVRKPEPYKGKGIRYKDEHIIRKAGKAASA